MNKILRKIKFIIIFLVMLASCNVYAIECTKYKDCRYQGYVIRNEDGSIPRDYKVVIEYKKIHPCPSTGLHYGACPGWSLNHNCPLACGCVDAVWNLSWMRNDVKKIVDGYERKINALSPMIPDTGACINVKQGK